VLKQGVVVAPVAPVTLVRTRIGAVVEARLGRVFLLAAPEGVTAGVEGGGGKHIQYSTWLAGRNPTARDAAGAFCEYPAYPNFSG